MNGRKERWHIEAELLEIMKARNPIEVKRQFFDKHPRYKTFYDATTGELHNFVEWLKKEPVQEELL